MGVHKKNIILLFFVLTCCLRAEEIKVYAVVDRSQRIYVGDLFVYQIVIDGAAEPGQVDLAPLADFNPRHAGNTDASQTTITIVNGKTTRREIKSYKMNYHLTAIREGSNRIPSVNVVIDGKTYTTDPLVINAVKPGESKEIQVTITLSESRCYVGEPVIMDIKWTVPGDPRNLNFNVPILYRQQDFYYEDAPFTKPAAAKGQVNIGSVVLPYQKNVILKNGREYDVYTFRKVLIPKSPGSFDFEPVTTAADLPVGYVRSRDPFDLFGRRYRYSRFIAATQRLSLQVLPLPEENQPDGFYGLVGHYTIEAEAAPVNVNVGDPITLTVRIGGSDYLAAVEWPDLEAIPEMAENFKLPNQKASPSVKSGYKIFKQTIRAENDKVTRIPPIPLVYFDSGKGEYVVTQTDPIPLKVATTKVLTASDLQGMDFTPAGREVEAIKEGLAANYDGEEMLNNMYFDPVTALVCPSYAWVWALPFAVFVASAVMKILSHTNPARQKLQRKRRAYGVAAKKLKQLDLNQAMSSEVLLDILRQFIADRFEKNAGILTADECRNIITDKTNDPTLGDTFAGLVETLEASRYASLQTNIDCDFTEKAMKLIDQINRKGWK